MDAGEVVWQTEKDYAGAHRQELASMIVPTIQVALENASWHKSELDMVVVGIGPGSFTGIRSGIVTARTLAQALKLPLIGISLLECYAVNQGLPCGVILTASAGHCFVAAYAEGNRLPVVSPAYLSFSELDNILPKAPCWLADEKALNDLQALNKRVYELMPLKNIASIEAKIALDEVSLTMPAIANTNLQGRLMELYPYKEVEPLYLRGPSVTIKKSHGHSN